jgi:hypothetical protein
MNYLFAKFGFWGGHIKHMFNGCFSYRFIKSKGKFNNKYCRHCGMVWKKVGGNKWRATGKRVKEK